MVGQLVTLLLVGAAAVPAPGAGCPSPEAVAAELARLGTASAVAAVATPEIRVHGATMRVALRGLDGAISGVREVAAPGSCAERASVAAVLVSAWVGAWRAGSFPEASPPLGAKATPVDAPPLPAGAPAGTGRSQPAPSAGSLEPPAADVRAPAFPASPGASPAGTFAPGLSPSVARPLSAPSPARASPSRPVRALDGLAAEGAPAGRPARRSLLELGGFGFGMHDGDAGTFGGGMQVGFRFPGWLGLDAVFAVGGQRERAMVRGTAAYRLYGLGLGLSFRKRSGSVFADLGVLPDITLLRVEGRNLNPGRSFGRWGIAADARVRLGLALGSWRPFVFAGASYALRAERLTLDDYPEPEHSITLSRWNFSFGLGLAYLFGATTKA
jgi:hypothetical protein